MSYQPLVDRLAAAMPAIAFTAPDGSRAGPPDEARATVSIHNEDALAHIVRGPRGIGFARALATGAISIEGDLRHFAGLEVALSRSSLASGLLRAVRPTHFTRAARLGPLESEFRQSPRSRATAIAYHYDLPTEFYELLLGDPLVYSCAIFEPGDSLAEAQRNKLQTVVDKLELKRSSHLLDLGCGWGGLLQHAIDRTACTATGVTLSKSQAKCAAERTSATVVHGDISRCIAHFQPTAVSSVGVYEHVGRRGSQAFFNSIAQVLAPGALYLNQSIYRSSRHPKRFRRRSFAQRFVFPDAQLLTLHDQLRDLEGAGFTIKSIELIGTHYVSTLECWLENLRANRDSCVTLIGAERYRAFEIYLAGSAARFERRDLGNAQVLAIRNRTK